MNVQYSKQAAKTLMKMGRKGASKIREKIDLLATDRSNESLDVKPMAGSDGLYRLRVGGWRVIFSEDGVILSILKIGPRGDVYK